MDEKKYGPQEPEQERMSGEQVQRELEYQLREFGVSVSDAFQHGFEGRGQELGGRAWDVGRAVVDAVNFGVSEVGRAMDRAREKSYGSARDARPEKDRPAADYSGLYDQDARQGGGTQREEYRAYRRARQDERRAACRDEAETACMASGAVRNPLYTGSRRLFSTGLAMAIVGGIFAFGLIIGGVSCLASMGLFLKGTAEYTALAITGGALTAVGCIFGALCAEGGNRLEKSRRMRTYGDAADALGAGQGINLRQLASAVQRAPKKVRKDLRKYIRKGWLTAWLDADEDRLYLTAESYRAAQGQPEPAPQAKEAQPEREQPEQPAPKTEQEGAGPALSVEAVRRFSAVLEQEKRLMADEQAADELEHMHATTQAICDWLDAHPESLPKARRFAEYYFPTTLKLLHTYNGVQGQKGENAENIRRDIAGILHTLNLAYDNLYDKLLSDMALDVSSEIAALQGMLACDGLTEEGQL